MNKSISIIQYVPEDFPEYYTLVKQEEVMKYIAYRGLTLEEARAKFDGIFEIYRNYPALGHFKVRDAGGNFIGTCKLELYKHDKSLFEIGYILKKDYWLQGYGTMICETLLDLADKLDPSLDVIGVINPENIASRKLLEKFGFKSYFVGMEDGMKTEKLKLKKERS